MIQNISNGKTIILVALLFSIISCKQEKLLFHPTKLNKEHKFSFRNNYQEFFIPVKKGIQLNGVLFPAQSSKGLVFYLHGNGGSIETWGQTAEVYLKNQYDFFIIDYRGFGKSDGQISNEEELYQDIQIVYDSLKKFYFEEKIIIIGFSIGTGLAAKLASTNNPRWLILNAPYYNLKYLAKQYIKIVPILFLKFKLETNVYLPKVKCPVTIFHGDQDEVINVNSSKKLKKHFKKNDQLFILHGQKHKNFNTNEIYQKELKKILETNPQNFVVK